MVKETSVMKLCAFVANRDSIFPDLKDWNYRELYKRDGKPITLETESEVERRVISRWLHVRDKKIIDTTAAICSFIEMDFDDRDKYKENYLKDLIKYYLVLMDARKYNLNYEFAYDEIFEGI